MEQDKTAKRDHELKDLEDFGKTRFDPDNLADTKEEQEELDAERYYGRDDKPSGKRAPGGKGNPELG